MDDESVLLKEALQWLDVITSQANSNSAQFLGVDVKEVIPDSDRLNAMNFVRKANAILEAKKYT